MSWIHPKWLQHSKPKLWFPVQTIHTLHLSLRAQSKTVIHMTKLVWRQTDERVTNVCRWFPSREFQRAPGRDGRHSEWSPVYTPTDQTCPRTHCTAATDIRHTQSINQSINQKQGWLLRLVIKIAHTQIKIIPRLNVAWTWLLYRHATLAVHNRRCNNI